MNAAVDIRGFSKCIFCPCLPYNFWHQFWSDPFGNWATQNAREIYQKDKCHRV